MIRRLFLFILAFLVLSTDLAFAEDFRIIKKRVTADLLKIKIDDKKISKLLETITEEGTWLDIDYENIERTGFEHRFHTSNMVNLAEAYCSNISKYYKSKKVKHTLNVALKNWVDNDYKSKNWWHNQIGTPTNLVIIMMLVGDELDAELVKKAQPIINRANINAPGARPGGDRIKVAGIHAKNLLFLNDVENFEKVIDVIENEIQFVEWIGMQYGYGFKEIKSGFDNQATSGGRGLQYDYSFHHRTDGVNNTLSYGMNYANIFAEWGFNVRGTKYAFSNEKTRELINYYLDGICKTSVFGKYIDTNVKNRGFSRKGGEKIESYSSVTPKKLMQILDFRKDELQEIIDIRSKNIEPTSSHATYYWHSEHFTFQRPNFFTSVRMYSNRIYNMEYPHNSEGILNHHLGDAANFLSRIGDEYFNIAAVFDFQKIPGATIMQKPELPPEQEVPKPGLTSFVGATTDGKYAAVACDFQSVHDPLIAKKAWFFFDEEYVCLGSGISSREKLSVVTTINQCLLDSDVTIGAGGEKNILDQNEKAYKNVDWVYHDSVGYVFPKPTLINIKNNKAIGSWFRINKHTDTPKDEIKKEVFKLWIDHGFRPSEESYEYIVVPATSIKKLVESNSKNNVIILSNTPEIQAVKNKELNMLQAVFYKAGSLEIDEKLKFTCQSPGIIILKYEDDKIIQISLSDPNRELGKMHLSISSKIEMEEGIFNAVWDEKKKITEMVFDLPQGNYAGKSVTVDLIGQK